MAARPIDSIGCCGGLVAILLAVILILAILTDFRILAFMEGLFFISIHAGIIDDVSIVLCIHSLV